MKKVLFVLLLFVGFGFANAMDPPDDSKTTFAEETQTNLRYVAQDWNVLNVVAENHQEGNFIIIKYENGVTELAYCSKIVANYTPLGFTNFKYQALKTSEGRNTIYLRKALRDQNAPIKILNASSGGEPSLYGTAKSENVKPFFIKVVGIGSAGGLPVKQNWAHSA